MITEPSPDRTVPRSTMKPLKTWKTIIQFVITVLTAIVSSFLTQSCMNG